MSKIIAIATNDVEDIELSSPVKKLKEAGHTVDLVEKQAGRQIIGKHGNKFDVDKSIDGLKISDYDALLIPGGFSPDQLRADDRFVDLVKDFLLANKPVFAICHGPQLFIQAGLASELTLTAYLTVRRDLYYAGARVKDEPVVIDKKHDLITSRTPADLDAFNTAIVDRLAN